MPKFLLRKNCEYSLVVEAKDIDEAVEKAENTPDEDWEQAWSCIETDDDE